MSTKPSQLCVARLAKELRMLQKDPVSQIEAVPDPENILEWHYVLQGPPSTPYEGGYFHGLLKFSPEYPHKPPSIIMFTPNGRFETNMRLCLSMSDYHPETWNPVWSVSSILIGLVSFMTEESAALGSIERSTRERRQLAAASLEFNMSSTHFLELFPHLVELRLRQRREEAQQSVHAASSETGALSPRVARLCAIALITSVGTAGFAFLVWALLQ